MAPQNLYGLEKAGPTIDVESLPIRKAGTKPGFIQRVLNLAKRSYQDPRRILNPTSLRGGLVYGTALDFLSEKLGIPEAVSGPVTATLQTPGGLGAKALAFLVANDLYNTAPVKEGTIYNPDGSLTESAKEMQAAAIKYGKPDPFAPVTSEETFMYGKLPPTARVPSQYPEGVPTTGNMETIYPESAAPIVLDRDMFQGTEFAETHKYPSEEPKREQGSSGTLPGRDTTLSTPKTQGVDMQSELLKDAMTMRRAKEMAELGIYGGKQAMTKNSDMYRWVHNHGDLADDLIRDKRMKEVRIARMFGRDLPTDPAGMDGQMGNFEAMREMA